MKEAYVSVGPKVSIKDVPIPTPNADQVVIKVVVSGSNPKDWKVSNKKFPAPIIITIIFIIIIIT